MDPSPFFPIQNLDPRKGSHSSSNFLLYYKSSQSKFFTENLYLLVQIILLGESGSEWVGKWVWEIKLDLFLPSGAGILKCWFWIPSIVNWGLGLIPNGGKWAWPAKKSVSFKEQLKRVRWESFRAFGVDVWLEEPIPFFSPGIHKIRNIRSPFSSSLTRSSPFGFNSGETMVRRKEAGSSPSSESFRVSLRVLDLGSLGPSTVTLIALL